MNNTNKGMEELKKNILLKVEITNWARQYGLDDETQLTASEAYEMLEDGVLYFTSQVQRQTIERCLEAFPKKKDILWGQDRRVPMMDNPVFAVISGTLSNGQDYKHITDIVENHEITREIQNCLSIHQGELTSEVFDAKVFSHTDMESEIFYHDYHINPENREDVGFNQALTTAEESIKKLKDYE